MISIPMWKLFGDFTKNVKRVAVGGSTAVTNKQDRAENTTLIVAGVALLTGVSLTILAGKVR